MEVCFFIDVMVTGHLSFSSPYPTLRGGEETKISAFVFCQNEVNIFTSTDNACSKWCCCSYVSI